MQKHGCSFDVAEKLKPEAGSHMRPLDKTGNICYDETSVFAKLHYTQVRHERRKRIISNLRLCRRNDRYKSRFARIGKSYEPHVSQEFKFEDEPLLFSFFSRLRKLGRLPGRSCKVGIAQASSSSLGSHQFRIVGIEVGDDLPAFGVLDDRADRNKYYLVFCILPVLVAPFAVLSPICHVFLPIPLIEQSIQFLRGPYDDMSAPASVSSIGAAFRNKLLPPETHASSAAVSSLNIYFYVINKLHKQKRQSALTDRLTLLL